jgi:hypothetical protein
MYPLFNHLITCQIFKLIYFKINSNHIKLYFIFHFGITFSKSNENRDIFVPVHNCIELMQDVLGNYEPMHRMFEPVRNFSSQTRAYFAPVHNLHEPIHRKSENF